MLKKYRVFIVVVGVLAIIIGGCKGDGDNGITTVSTLDGFSFQNFEENNGTPPGGGNYFWDAWFTTCSFSERPEPAYQGQRAVRVETYAGNSGYNGGTVGINPSSSNPIDLSSAATISVWVYDTNGDNTLELKLRDSNDAVSNAIWSTMESVRNVWTEITWNFSDFTGVNKSQIKNIELYEYNDGIYYFDDVSWE